MFRINDLKDIGIGKKCLIIGGGNSVSGFDFSKVEDYIKIGVNEAGIKSGIKTDYLIYNDTCFLPVLAKLDTSKVKVICFQNNYCKQPHYAYSLFTFNDFGYSELREESNTGLKAVIIAKHIMKFDEIYLTGFDFDVKVINGKEQSHFWGDDVGHNKKFENEQHLQDHFKRLDYMVKEFDILKDILNIYNCNSESKLKRFQFKNP